MPRRASALLAGADDAMCMLVAAGGACVGTEYGDNRACLPGWATVAAHHSVTVAIR